MRNQEAEDIDQTSEDGRLAFPQSMNLPGTSQPAKRSGNFVMDDRGLPLEEAQLQSPKRRRGRPPGAKGKTIQGTITADDIAFLRATIQGVSPRVALEQYLAHLGVGVERKFADTYAEVLHSRLVAMGLAWPELAEQVEVVWPQIKPTTAQFDAPHAPEANIEPRASSQRPTLEEFAERFDPDMFSESELIELYEEEFGESTPSNPATATPDSTLATPAELGGSTADMKRKLQALDWMDRRLAVKPKPEDHVTQWLSLTPAQKDALRNIGVVSLGDLRNYISLTGVRWWTSIPRYGRIRGKRLSTWLAQSGIRPNEGLERTEGPAAGRDLEKARRSHLTPLGELYWPEDLRGESGGFRSDQSNTLNANNDLEAIKNWFGELKKKPATMEAYQRAIERLALWAITERRLAISALSTTDIRSFFDFLRSPPAHWVQPRLRTRAASDWRPLKGPLNDSSMNVTNAAVRHMFNSWFTTGYLRLNPVESFSGVKRNEIKMDVLRSFTVQDREVIAEVIQEMEDGPRKRRLVALIRLLQTSGLRRSEMIAAEWQQIERVRVEGQLSDSLALRLVGKGGKERVVPMHEETLEALRAHREDRIALIESGKLRLRENVAPEEMPLIGILDERLAGESEGTDGVMPHNARRSANARGGLSNARAYGLLKAFFLKCAQKSGKNNSDFMAASTHWLRHTFALDSLEASGNDARVVQQLLGHADINTTMIYLKVDMSTRAATIQKIKPMV